MRTMILIFIFLAATLGQSLGVSGIAEAAVVEKSKDVEEHTTKDFVAKESTPKDVTVNESVAKDFTAKESVTNELVTKESVAKDVPAKTDFDEAQINYKAVDEESTPILTKNKNKVEEQSGALYKTISAAFILLLLGGLALWYLKKKSLMGENKPTAMQIKVLTQYHLAPRKTLTVVRVAGESLLIGVTENQITLLKSLSLLDEDIPETIPKNFKQTFAESAVDASIDKPPKNTVLKSPEFTDADEEFSFGNIKHLVENKLKGMKRW